MTQHHLRGRAGDSIRLGTAVLLVVGLAGCSKSLPFDPAGSSSSLAATHAEAALGGFGAGTFYPLAVGNTWNYEGLARISFINSDGSPGDGPVEIPSSEADRIVGTEDRNGRTYFVREEIYQETTDPSSVSLVAWTRLRQDRGGLFGADMNSDEPPALQSASSRYVAPDATPGRPRLDLSSLEARGVSKEAVARFAARIDRVRSAVRSVSGAAGAARAGDVGELTMLLYPLHKGVEWNIRPDMPWPAWVDGMEVVASPMGPLAAYRIGIVPGGEPLGDGEYVWFYYGRVGFVGYRYRLSAPATDENGNPTGGLAIVEETRMLVSTSPNS